MTNAINFLSSLIYSFSKTVKLTKIPASSHECKARKVIQSKLKTHYFIILLEVECLKVGSKSFHSNVAATQ